MAYNPNTPPYNTTISGISDGNNTLAFTTTSSDNSSPNTTRIPTVAHNKSFNGTGWDNNKGTGGAQVVTFSGLNSNGVSSLTTDGTNTVNVLKSDGTAAGQNAELVAPTYLSVPFTTTSAQAVGTTDAGNYKSVSVHIASQGGSSNVAYQGSNDNVNWIAITLFTAGTTNGSAPVSNDSLSNIIRSNSLNFRYFRLNVTGIVSGTTAGTIVFSSSPSSQNTIATRSNDSTGAGVPSTAFYVAGVNGSGNLTGAGMTSATTNAAAGGFLGVGLLTQFDDVSPQTVTENNFGNLRMSTNRNLYNTIRDAAGNERGANVNAANEMSIIDQGLRPAATALNTSASRISTNTTTTPTASLAYVSSIVVCVETAGTTSTVDIRDKSGTPIYLVRSLSTTAVLNNGDLVYNFQTPIKMTGGIDIITGGSVAATIGVFINYYQ